MWDYLRKLVSRVLRLRFDHSGWGYVNLFSRKIKVLSSSLHPSCRFSMNLCETQTRWLGFTVQLRLLQLHLICYIRSIHRASSDSGGGSSSMERNNEAFAKEFELEFNDLVEFECRTLLCWQCVALHIYEEPGDLCGGKQPCS